MKVYQRIENGTATHVSIREGLDEINNAQMAGRREVRTMSSITSTDYAIEYRDGRSVKLTRVDAPEPATETEDWASTRTGTMEHRFDSDGRALCNRRLRAYNRPISETDRRTRRTRSEIENSKHGYLYTFCPKCEQV